MKLYLHTIGTSIITNEVSEEQRRQFIALSNEKTLDVTNEDIVAEAIGSVLNRIENLSGSAKFSAELKALAQLCPFGSEQGDLHFLLHTYTRLGHLAAGGLADAFKKCGFHYPELVPVAHLSTASKQAFHEGIKWLINWCEETLPAYQQGGYEIFFNLTGGFKSLQGYMNIIGMFYADKIVYIFETGNELLEIPKLPVQLDLERIRKSARSFLLADFTICEKKLVNDLPSVYLDQDHSHCTLSPIGKLIWNRYKRKILSEELIQWPNLVYESSFCNDFRAANRDPVKLQEVLAKVSYLLSSSNGNIFVLKKDGGLLYEDFQNQKIDGKPVGHFRVSLETRVSCIYSGDKLILRHFGAHDYVNKNA